jgi:hypothetical protein
MVSVAATQALTNPYSDDTILVLLEISAEGHDTGYFVNYDVNITHQGNEYIAYPFIPVLPNADDERAPRGSIQIDNVHRDITLFLRTIQEPALLTIKVVHLQDPEDIITEFDGFQIVNADGNAETITAEITIEDFASEPVPCISFVPAFFHAIV